MKSRNFLFLTTIIAIFITGCSNAIPDNFDYGTIDNNVYKNEYFDFTVPIPKEWHAQTRAENDKLTNFAQQSVADTTDADAQSTENNTLVLLSLFKHPLGALVPFNPSLIVVAENTRGNYEITNETDYLKLSSEMLKTSGLNITEIDSLFNETNIGDQKFYLMNTTVKLDDIEYQQSFHTLYNSKFCLNIITSYTNEAEKKELENILSKIKFN